MAIDVQHIRVMNTSDGKMSLIIGTDILQKSEDKFREVSTRTMKDGKEIIVEVGPLGYGECFTMRAKMPYFRG